MSEYGLAVLIVIGVTVGVVVAAAIVRGVVWAVISLLRLGTSTGGIPNSAGKPRWGRRR